MQLRVGVGMSIILNLAIRTEVPGYILVGWKRLDFAVPLPMVTVLHRPRLSREIMTKMPMIP